MGFLDFFKKKKIEIEIEEISFDELGDWIANKKKSNKNKEKEIINSVDNNVKELLEKLEEQIRVLENINIDQKKVDDRAKLIVRENLHQYIYYLKKLIDNLNNLERDANIINNIDKLLSDFSLRSNMSFQKATFIIGDELGKVREDIADFSRNLKNIIENNKDFIENIKVISLVDEKLKKIEELDKLEIEINGNLDNGKKEIEDLRELNKKIESNIREIENTEEYLVEKRKEEELQNKKDELDKRISNIRNEIDFKSLTNIYHSSEKSMEIVKEYRDNFKEAFEKTNGEAIINLIKEANMGVDAILNEVRKIDDIKKEIDSIDIKDMTQDLDLEIPKNEHRIAEIDSEMRKHEKRLDKIKEKREEIISIINQELNKINVDLK